MKDNRKNKHEVQGIANANNITEHRAVRDAKVGVKVG